MRILIVDTLSFPPLPLIKKRGKKLLSPFDLLIQWG